MGHEKLAQFSLRRVIAAPPGLPADIQNRLADAFIAAANSPGVKEWAAGARVDLDAVGAEETSKLMADLSTFYAEYKDILMAK